MQQISPRISTVPARVSSARAPEQGAAPRVAKDVFAAPKNKVETGGIHDSILNKLPRGVGMVAHAISHFPLMAIASIKRALFPPKAAPADTAKALDRAKAVMADTRAQLGVPGLPGDFMERARSADAPKQGLKDAAKAWAKNGSSATVWPFGQVLAAELDIAAQTGDYKQVDVAMKRLQRYWDGESYRPGQMGGTRYYDDNAWLGLDLMQAYAQTGNKSYLAQAEKLVPWMKSGLREKGGIYWRENQAVMSLNTCTNAPTIQYMLRLYMATKKPEYLALAKNLDAALNKELRDPKTGLYWDNLGDDGKMDRAIHAYNQGTPVGADVLWYRLTGDKKYLERATQTANAALDHYAQGDRLWKSPPAFNAIMFRNLLALDQFAPNPRIRQMLNAYTDRLWKEGRDPQTGLFTRNGMGSYDAGHGTADVLDQGGVAQLFALRDMPAAKLLDVA